MPDILLAFLALLWIVNYFGPAEMGFLSMFLFPTTVMAIIWRILHGLDPDNNNGGR